MSFPPFDVSQKHFILSFIESEVARGREEERAEVLKWAISNAEKTEPVEHECHIYCCGKCWCEEEQNGVIILGELSDRLSPKAPNTTKQ